MITLNTFLSPTCKHILWENTNILCRTTPQDCTSHRYTCENMSQLYKEMQKSRSDLYYNDWYLLILYEGQVYSECKKSSEEMTEYACLSDTVRKSKYTLMLSSDWYQIINMNRSTSLNKSTTRRSCERGKEVVKKRRRLWEEGKKENDSALGWKLWHKS